MGAGETNSPVEEHPPCIRSKQGYTSIIVLSQSTPSEIPVNSDSRSQGTECCGQVTYRYYIGVIAFLNEDFEKVATSAETPNDSVLNYSQAEKELTSAFYNCHVKAQGNRQYVQIQRNPRLVYERALRRILSYLIPLRILRGHLPSDELLDMFPVLSEIYSPFINSIRKADIKAYDDALAKLERRLLELNTWLIIERARELVVRGLFRKV